MGQVSNFCVTLVRKFRFSALASFKFYFYNVSAKFNEHRNGSHFPSVFRLIWAFESAVGLARRSIGPSLGHDGGWIVSFNRCTYTLGSFAHHCVLQEVSSALQHVTG